MPTEQLLEQSKQNMLKDEQVVFQETFVDAQGNEEQLIRARITKSNRKIVPIITDYQENEQIPKIGQYQTVQTSDEPSKMTKYMSIQTSANDESRMDMNQSHLELLTKPDEEYGRNTLESEVGE